MPFQLMGRLGPRDDVLDVGPDSPLGSGKFWGMVWHNVMYWENVALAVQKRLNQSSCCLE